MGFYDVGLTFNATNAKPRTLNESQLHELCGTIWSGKDIDNAVQVALAESSGRSDVESSNPDGNKNIGLFQIDTVNVRCANCLKDTVYNANVAHRMWLADGGTFTKRWESAAKGGLPKLNHPGGVGDEATNPTDDVSRAASSGLDAIGNLANQLMSGEFWQRFGKVILGGVLIVGAMIYFISEFMTKNVLPKIPAVVPK